MNRLLIVLVVVAVLGCAMARPEVDITKRGSGCHCPDGTTGIFWAGKCPSGWTFCDRQMYWIVPGECCQQ
uniref:Delta-actitoxin-Nan sodium channel inhibitory toxin n=1 Tax=Nemanthus annamensis TaxID=1813764 RepID=A0A3P8MJV0_9CNID|nr:Delta-actitoxin-Nan sodium channel inhibitory toxin [Nemanthus annamensis]